MDGATPVTVGLVIAMASCVGTGLLLFVWLTKTLKAMEKEILMAFDARLRDVRSDVEQDLAETQNVVDKLSDRLTTMVLAQAEHRAFVAENYMSKVSNSHIITQVSGSIDVMRKELGDRLTRLEDRVIAKITSTASN